jgi:hypothetical protein
MNRRKFLSITAQMGCGSLIGAGLVGCGSATRSGSAEAGANDLAGKRVGISSPHKAEILNELYNDMRREAERPENGLEVVVVDAGRGRC